MDARQKREAGKARYQQFREQAKAIARWQPGIEVPEFANVQPCEGGAFVEAVIFVPDGIAAEDGAAFTVTVLGGIVPNGW